MKNLLTTSSIRFYYKICVKPVKTLRFILFLMLLIPFSNTLTAQPAAIVNKFLIKSHTYGGITVPYRLYIPENYDPTQSYPIVLTLHGIGECGTDNHRQIELFNLGTGWAFPANQAKRPCFVVSPQAPVNINFSTAVMSNIINVLDSIIANYSIDTNRQYVTGLSLGGNGTWKFINNYPTRFAAAVPMSGWYDPDISNLKTVAIWNIHGQTDPTVLVTKSQYLIETLARMRKQVVYTNQKYRKAINLSTSDIERQINNRADLIYSEYYNTGHDGSLWSKYYNDTIMMKWLFKQYRKEANAITFSNYKVYKTIQNIDTIKWTSKYLKDSVELWFSPDNGVNWETISTSEPNTGKYAWNLSSKEDCVFGLIRIFQKNNLGQVYASAISENFAINNNSNGKPLVKIVDNVMTPNIITYSSSLFDKSLTSSIMNKMDIKSDSLNLFLQLGDPEKGDLKLNIWYSSNNGTNYTKIDSATLTGSVRSYSKWIRLDKLQKSNSAKLKVDITDGQMTVSDSTISFMNSNGIRVTSIENPVQKKSEFFCYQNPTNHQMTVVFGQSPIQEATINIYNIQGKRIFSNLYQNTMQSVIDLTAQVPGIYLVKCTTDKKVTYQKVMQH